MSVPIGVLMSNKKEILTVEISDPYLKLAHIRAVKDKNEIARVACFEATALSDDEISEHIRDFCREQRLKKCEVLNIIPSQYAISKNIEIPSIDKKEIKEIIDLQAGRHTPYSRDEIIMDYADVGVFHGRYTKILLVIIKRDVVTKRHEIIKKAGLDSNFAVLSAVGVSLWFFDVCPDRAGSEPLAVFHLDGVTMDCSIGYPGKNLYIRSVPLPFAQIKAQAPEEKAKLFDEIKKTMEAYQSENIDAQPVKLYVTGVVAPLMPLAEEISKAVGYGIDFLSAEKMLPLPEAVRAVLKTYPGVSLLPVMLPPLVTDRITINLIPEDIKIKRELKQKGVEATLTGILAMLVLILLCSALLTGMLFRNFYLQKLLSSYTAESEDAEALKEVSQRTMVIKRFVEQKDLSLFVLSEMFKAMPKEVFLNSISFRDGETLIITGTADSMSGVFSLVTELENNTLFKNVKVDFTKSRRVQGKEVADFGLTFQLEGRG